MNKMLSNSFLTSWWEFVDFSKNDNRDSGVNLKKWRLKSENAL